MNDHPDVLIDASNLRAGGGVQVAASFLDELSRIAEDTSALQRFPWLRSSTRVEVTSEVISNVTQPVDKLDVTIISRRPMRRILSGRSAHEYAVSFTIFGPDYGRRRARRRIVGFADGVSLHPDSAELQNLGITRRARWALRSRLSRFLYSRTDHLVVEARHVKDALINEWRIPEYRIHVVPNVLNGVFYDRDLWAEVDVPRADSTYNVCYVTRAYPHKNLQLLGVVGGKLRDVYGVPIRFVVTLEESEWLAQSAAFRSFAVNVGPLKVAQLPLLYRHCAAAVFPSLLESFSVTPLEALATGCPLVASDREFVRDIVGDCASYFDPHDADNAAKELFEVLTSTARSEALRSTGVALVDRWPRGRDRAMRYLELIQQNLYA